MVNDKFTSTYHQSITPIAIGLERFLCQFFLPESKFPTDLNTPTTIRARLRPYPGENTASRPISHSQAPESPVSIVVGDHTRILGAAIFFEI